MFGSALGDVSALSPGQVYARAVQGVLSLQQQYTVLPFAPAHLSDGTSNRDESDNSGDASRGGGPLQQSPPLPLMNLLHHGHLVSYGGK